MSQREIQQRIEHFLIEKRSREKMELLIAADKDEQIVDPLETGQVEDKQRTFLVNYRPHQDVKVWNFIEDNEEVKVPHVLRANADPNKAYIDGRVADLLVIMEGMAKHLSLHNQEGWDHLNKHTMLIFKDHEEKMNRRMTDFEKAQEEAAQK